VFLLGQAIKPTDVDKSPADKNVQTKPPLFINFKIMGVLAFILIIVGVVFFLKSIGTKTPTTTPIQESVITKDPSPQKQLIVKKVPPIIEKTPIADKFIPKTEPKEATTIKAEVVQVPTEKPLAPKETPINKEKTKPLAPDSIPTNTIDTVELQARADTWLKYTIGTNEDDAKELTLREGQKYFIKTAESVKLFLGNAGGIKIIYNKKELPYIGNHGEVRTIVLPDKIEWLLKKEKWRKIKERKDNEPNKKNAKIEKLENSDTGINISN